MSEPTPSKPTSETTATPTPAKAGNLPTSFASDKLEVKKATGQSITLSKVSTSWGKADKQWQYPSLVITDKEEENKLQQEALEEFLGPKETALMLLEAWDSLCQRTWKEHQTEAGFITALTTEAKRLPKKMSVFYDSQRKAQMKLCREFKESEAFKANKPETLAEYAKLKAEHDRLLKLYQEAAMAELEAAASEEI